MENELRAPGPPGWTTLLREARGLLELGRLVLEARSLAAQPRGRQQPVIVLPGYGASDRSTVVLRAYLSWLGYRVRGWGLGVNRGDLERLIPAVSSLVRRLAERTGQPVGLVGWSLGGVLAREAARDEPDSVTRVITLGTPVIGGPKYTTVAHRYEARGYDVDGIAAAADRREGRAEIAVPITAIYSRADSIVAWQACLDRRNPQVEHVEVRATHLGLGLSPAVLRIVARRLAAG